MAESRLSVLGGCSLQLGQVTAPGLATQKARALLTYLVTHRRSDVGRERLLELFWPGVDPERAQGGLRSALWSIRRAIRDAGFEPDDYLSANRSVIRWHAQTELDADTFVELARSEEAQHLEDALALYRGDYLEGDYEEWSVTERTRLSIAHESVLSRLVRITHSHAAAQALLGINPYDEPSYIVLIEAELSAGRLVAAEALAERCERALAEVGARASSALLELFHDVSSRRIQATPKLMLPFVGREVELARVRDLLEERSGTKTALLISGEPGIGKTTFLSHAGDVARSLGRLVLNVACLDGDARPFGPFEELCRDLCDAPLDPLPTRDEIDPALRLAEALFSAIGIDAVLFVDDAHTLTPEGLRVLAMLAGRLCARGQVAVIATRTEGRQPIASALVGCSCEDTALGPLRFDELRAAVDAMIADDEQKVASAIFERSGGHPLFAKTLIDSMAQAGLLRPDRGIWRVVGPLDSRSPLPVSLTSYIQVRLRTRGETAFAVATALALEPYATVDDIICVLGLPESKVYDALDDLLALNVVYQPPSGPELAFAHELYREVAGALINIGRRSQLHRAFAERFARSETAGASLRRARHLSLAGESLKAAEAYYVAALEALGLRAWVETRNRCDAGLACLERVDQAQSVQLVARFKLLRARAQAELGDLSSAIASASDAIAIAKGSAETDTMLKAALARQRALLDAFDAGTALASACETASMAREAHDDASLSIALADQSCARRLLANEPEAISSAEEAERLANSAGDVDVLCYALEQQLLVGATWWRFSAGLNAAARAERAMITAGTPAKIGLLCARAFLNLSLGRDQDAESDIAACEALLADDVDQSNRILFRSAIGTARLKLSVSAASVQLALRRGLCNRALLGVVDLERMKLPHAHALAELFRADILFESETQDMATEKDVLPKAQCAGLFVQDVCSGSRSPTVADALNATRLQSTDAPAKLTRALNAVEGASRRTPLDADRAFAQLARAAEMRALVPIAARARLRCDRYGELRAMARSVVNAPRTLESTAR